MSIIKIQAYGCSSSAGPSSQDLWRGLNAGVDHSHALEDFSSRVCAWPDSSGSSLELLTNHLLLALKDTKKDLKDGAKLSPRLGVILASTKGCINDWVWDGSLNLENSDPVTPVLESFLARSELDPIEKICVSSACASSLVGVLLAQEWIRQGRVDQVLLLAADHGSEFVRKGFECLKAVSTTRARPFDQARDGLYLGDAAAAILIGKEGDFEIEGIATNTEGFAVTRPEQTGASLRRACVSAGVTNHQPDVVIAHGTATQINDQTEDQVFVSLFGEKKIPVTATKWSIGHTLGASGAMDLIAACEILREQKIFSIGNSTRIDSGFGSHYLLGNEPLQKQSSFERVLVTSLGFGGIHAAALLKRSRQ
jgi:hypothetical protein